MFKSKKDMPQDASAIDSIIGEQCRLQGDLISQQSIKVDGTINGNIQVTGSVIIGEVGVVTGDIRCMELVVFGKIEGSVEVQKLQLKASANFSGNIQTQSLMVEEGAVYAGDIRMETPKTEPLASSANPSEKDKTTPPNNASAKARKTPQQQP